MKHCKICNKIIWFWQKHAYQQIKVVNIVGKEEMIQYNHCHNKCRENFLAPKERELLK
jgi:uncharacterized Fe-S center protein